jgi:hypothetical protein
VSVLPHSGVAALPARDHYLVAIGAGGYQQAELCRRLSGDATSEDMTPRLLFPLVNGVVAAMLLSACASMDKDKAKPAPVIAVPAVKAEAPEEPVLPKLKPKTKKRKPASPRLDEPEAAPPLAAEGASAGSDAHQQQIEQGAVPGSVDGTAVVGEADETASLPAPAVVPAEPVPLSLASSPDELKSKAETEVAKLLGRPDATRREGTGTIWTYRGGTCSLDVYFFLDVADNQRRALSYEILPEAADDDAIQTCYRAIKEIHRAP